jgi:hypothetical protein
MKLHSAYLNPFQPFPEREMGKRGEEEPRSATEDNLSRSVLSALANAKGPFAAAEFLQSLVAPQSSPALCTRVEKAAALLRGAAPDDVEFDLQSWPETAMQEWKSLAVLLIGVSSSHRGAWTHDQRPAPEKPRPDAWIYVPGKVLLVFEFKTDEHPLDATQISAYAHSLKLLREADNVPRAEPGQYLKKEEAWAVQKACAGCVLDAPWSAVAAALRRIRQEDGGGSLGRWLCGQAAAYVRWNIRPPYAGVATILEWLKDPDTQERRSHLRTLVNCMGNELRDSAQDRVGAITFAKDTRAKDTHEKWDLSAGSGSAVYVKLEQDGRPLTHRLLGKAPTAVLWFQFSEHGDDSQRVGLEYYLHAKGSDPGREGQSTVAWNKAREKHLGCAEPFEKRMAEWVAKTPPDALVTVSALCFKGKQRIWRGAVESPDGPSVPGTTPQGALEFLREHRDKLWVFPGVGPGSEAATIEQAAKRARKPAIGLLIPMDPDALAACSDGPALQKFLQRTVGGEAADAD